VVRPAALVRREWYQTVTSLFRRRLVQPKFPGREIIHPAVRGQRLSRLARFQRQVLRHAPDDRKSIRHAAGEPGFLQVSGRKPVIRGAALDCAGSLDPVQQRKAGPTLFHLRLVSPQFLGREIIHPAVRGQRLSRLARIQRQVLRLAGDGREIVFHAVSRWIRGQGASVTTVTPEDLKLDNVRLH
jgi:hypothetical protein